tara:strand:+ start:1104 stop:1328 length:225 start_codon:yes stop_codon:yes gene_type:complete
MGKKYKCTVVETYTKTIEILDDVDIANVDISQVYDFHMPDDSKETVVPLSNDSVVDLVYKDECFEKNKRRKANE